ncbi:MAG: DUF397 domain-containing protein [Pseudonocardiaceae bacterium]
MAALRDSKNPAGGALAWAAFTTSLRADTLS